LPDATITVPHIPAWGLCVFSAGLAWLGLWKTRRRLLGVVVMLIGLASPVLDHPPDLLVSDDGRLIAVRTAQGAFLQQTQDGSKFVRDAWAQYWAIGTFQSMPIESGLPPGSSGAPMPAGVATGSLDLTPGERPAGDGSEAIRCKKDACLLRPYPDRPGAMLARGAQHPDFCAQISVTVSAEPARGLCPRPWPQLVDRFTVWRNGSAAIWLEPDGARVVTDRAERGDRPWVPSPPKPRKTATPVLPLAVIDRVEQPAAPPSVPAPEASNGE
jgi:competence protein ComEC